MKLSHGKTPSARDRAIYDTVRIENKSQVVAAEWYGVSQSQVSRICHKVGQWMVRQQLTRRGSALEGGYLATIDKVRQLEQVLTWTREAYFKGLDGEGPPSTFNSESVGDKDARQTRTTRGKSGHGDPRMLAHYNRTLTDLCKARHEEARERAALIEERRQQFDMFNEDYQVLAALEKVEAARAAAKVLERQGLGKVELPCMNRSEVEAHVRKNFRINTKQSDVGCLPEVWQKVVRKVFAEPATIVFDASTQAAYRQAAQRAREVKEAQKHASFEQPAAAKPAGTATATAGFGGSYGAKPQASTAPPIMHKPHPR